MPGLTRHGGLMLGSRGLGAVTFIGHTLSDELENPPGAPVLAAPPAGRAAGDLLLVHSPVSVTGSDINAHPDWDPPLDIGTYTSGPDKYRLYRRTATLTTADQYTAAYPGNSTVWAHMVALRIPGFFTVTVGPAGATGNPAYASGAGYTTPGVTAPAVGIEYLWVGVGCKDGNNPVGLPSIATPAGFTAVAVGNKDSYTAGGGIGTGGLTGRYASGLYSRPCVAGAIAGTSVTATWAGGGTTQIFAHKFVLSA